MRQKFEITIGYTGDTKRRWTTLRGMDRIEDAVAAATGLAQVQPENGFVTVWVAKQKHHGREILVQTRRHYKDPLPVLLDSAQRGLAIILDKRKQSDARHAWLNRYPNRAFDVLLLDKDALAAWGKNDFPTVARYFEAQGVNLIKHESSVTLASV